MIDHDPRPPLRDFLTTFGSRTGEPLEAAALAEMSGYSVDDARAEGWPDLFAAAADHRLQVDRDAWSDQPAPGHPFARAFLRGLTYTAPVLALWAIFPRPITSGEIRFLALLVVLSWGGSMASSHVVGSWLPGDESRGWRIAIAVVGTAVLVTGVAGGVLLTLGEIGQLAALVGVIQVLYFFSASPLMLRARNPGMGVVALVGAAAGVGSLLASLPEPSAFSNPDAAANLRVVAAVCLVLPALLLLVQARRSMRATPIPGYAVIPERRDVAAFGAYGVMFGCLVLWVPIVYPSSPASILNLVVIGGIAVAEVAVTLMRERAHRLLLQPFDAQHFAPSARRLILAAACCYVLPVAIGTTALVVVLTGAALPSTGLILAGLTVLNLGAIQVLSLIGMSLHGIRPVAAAISVCSAALLVGTPLVEGSLNQIELYLGVLTVLGVLLLAVVMRLGGHPINFL